MTTGSLPICTPPTASTGQRPPDPAQVPKCNGHSQSHKKHLPSTSKSQQSLKASATQIQQVAGDGEKKYYTPLKCMLKLPCLQKSSPDTAIGYIILYNTVILSSILMFYLLWNTSANERLDTCLMRREMNQACKNRESTNRPVHEVHRSDSGIFHITQRNTPY